jgi:hypothetical protein
MGIPARFPIATRAILLPVLAHKRLTIMQILLFLYCTWVWKYGDASTAIVTRSHQNKNYSRYWVLGTRYSILGNRYSLARHLRTSRAYEEE